MLHLAALGNMAGYTGGNYAAFVELEEITPAGRYRQARIGVVSVNFSYSGNSKGGRLAAFEIKYGVPSIQGR